MTTPRLLFSMLALGAATVTAVRAQLMELTFDVGTTFRQDYVNTDYYFNFQEGNAHFVLRFDPQRPHASNDFVRIRVTDLEGGLIFNEHRALQSAGLGEFGYWVGFTNERNTGPFDRWFYENLILEMDIGGGVLSEGEWVPPYVEIDPYSELYVYGWSPMIQYVPPGHGGEYNFDFNATNVTLRFVPVPEPSTYGLAALAMLGAVTVWRRRRPRAASPDGGTVG